MAKPNYQFEKRQRELAKKQKKEEKALRKAHGPAAGADTESAEPAGDGDAPQGVAPDADGGAPAN